MAAVSWRGVFPAVCTQFTKDYALDVPATLMHVDALVAAGCHRLVTMGTGRENFSREPDVERDLLAATANHVKRNGPVLTERSDCATAGESKCAATARDCGADALMVLPARVYKGDAPET